jgi:chromosome segregation ATPase
VSTTYKQRNRDLAKENADLRAALATKTRELGAALRDVQALALSLRDAHAEIADLEYALSEADDRI